MIVVDPLKQWPHGLGPRMGPSAHLCSTVPGEAGTEELVAFALRIGMRRSWLQRPGTEHEHFDVFGARRARAVKAGAVELTVAGIAGVWGAKRVVLRERLAAREQRRSDVLYAMARDAYARLLPVLSEVVLFQELAAETSDLARRLLAGDRGALRVAERAASPAPRRNMAP